MIKTQFSKSLCNLCNKENVNLTTIKDNYIKIENLFIPYAEILHEILDLNFEFKCEGKSAEICKRCENNALNFYNFKKKCKLNLTQDQTEEGQRPNNKQHKLSDKCVFSTMQIVQEFIKKNGQVKEIKELENQLIISSVKLPDQSLSTSPEVTSTTFQEDLSSIKQEPLSDGDFKEELKELKIELKEEDEDAAEILGISNMEEEVENSSDSSLSRLPAFCANRFFDGNRFVSRSEYLESKAKAGNKKLRERRPEFWAAAIQKKLRNHGQQYRSVKGNLVPARKIGPSCNCRKNCGCRISENNRLINFKRYWQLEGIEKRKFIIEHIKLLKPKRALTKTRIFSRIMHHYLDVVNYDGSVEQIRVCKKMFCSTFAISNSVISNAFKIISKDLEKNFEH